MFGRHFGCSVCDFDWAMGWSHHVGGQFLICRSCGTYILASDGKSCWGAKNGERLRLFCGSADGWQPLEIFITVPKVRLENGISLFGNAVDGGIDCPQCGAKGAVTDTLQEGEPCPQCKCGLVEERGSCIY